MQYYQVIGTYLDTTKMADTRKLVHIAGYCLHKIVVIFLGILGIMLFIAVGFGNDMFSQVNGPLLIIPKRKNEFPISYHRTFPVVYNNKLTVTHHNELQAWKKQNLPLSQGKDVLNIHQESNKESKTRNVGQRQEINENIYTKRLKTLQKGCSLNTEDQMHARDPIFLYSDKTKAVACKGSKTGSSFLGAVFVSLEVDREADEVFRINRNGIHARVKTLKHVLDDETQNKNMESSLKIIVARDPYQRLFSVYIDKIYLLGSIGRGVEKMSGKKRREDMTNFCGYAVTFQDYLHAVLPRALSGHSINPHWAPVSTLCAACDIPYNLVCKTESLTRDTEYVLDKLNMSDSRRKSIKSMFYGKGLRNTVYSLIAAYLADYQTYKDDCPKYMLLMEKIWNVFKVQGYLHNSVPFPKGDFSKLKSINTKNITDIVVNGINTRPMSREDKIMQRRNALVSEYANVDQEAIRLIQKVYKLDFLLFGYDIKPPK